jgi:hypothetical protein
MLQTMKKNYLLLTAVLFASISFGQNNQQTPAETLVQPSSQSNAQEHNSRPLPASINSTQINSAGAVQGQHNCFSHELNEAHYASRGILNEYNLSYQQSAATAASMSFPETPGVNEISVIFHVVYNPSNPAENVSSAQIQALFLELQQDYQLLNADAANARGGLGFVPADADINFCLATQDPFGAPLLDPGIVRVSTTEDYYDPSTEGNKMKAAATGGSEIWDRNKYLNVWVCNITNGLNYGTAGYAYRPTTTYLPTADIDGIVIDYNIGFGSNVLTHEVGHYLGLDHTWGGSGGCGNDDNFTDTPSTDGPADQDPTFSCGLASYTSCGAVEVQYENYMDYATGCTVMFTQEQSNYMLLILQGIRGSLLLSPGCDPTNTPPVSAFTAIPAPGFPIIIPSGGSVNLIDESTNVPTGWAWTISGTPVTDWNYINGTNGASQDPQIEFYTVGTYNVTLTASNVWGADPTPESEINYIQVAAPATGTACDTIRNWDVLAGAGPISWSAPSVGYAHGNSQIGTETSLQWAEVYTIPAVTDIRAIEFAAAVVEDAGGSVIFKVWADNGGEPAAVPITTETVLLADIVAGSWNNVEFSTPAVGVVGTVWVGYELSYVSVDTFALYAQIVGAAQDVTSYDGSINGWTTIAATTGVGLTGLLDVLTSTGPAPAMDFTATNDEVCIGGDITVNGSTSTNNIDYRWYVTDDPWVTTLEESSTAGNTFNFPYAAGDYQIFLFGSASCYSDGVVMPVSLYDPVSATVTPTGTTCGNNDGSITVTLPLGGDLTTYYYSLDGINYQLGNIFTILAPGNYDVYVATLGNSCEAMYTVTVATSTAPAASAISGAAICPGGSTTVTATGGGTYQWFDGTTSIGTGASIPVSPASTTQYDCLVTVAGCVTSAQATVTVNPLPPAPVITAGSTTTICSGSSVDLTSSYPTNNVWSTTETSSTITVSTAGPVSVIHTDANGCSNTSVATTIVVNNAPVLSAGTVTEPTACGTSTGSIQVAGSGTGDISWSGTATGNANGVSLPYTIPGLAAGSYNITITDGNGCTSNILAQGLNDPTPPVSPTITPGGATTFCDGGTVVLTSSYGSGNSWTTTETTPTISVTTSQTISVTYTDGFGCSSTSAPIVITVNANPAVPTITAGGPLTFCEGGSVDLTSSQGSGNTWSTAGTTQTISVTTSGSITVLYTNGNGCTATSAATDVVVNPLPTIALIAMADVCDYTAPVTLSGATPAGGTYSGPGVTGTTFDPAAAGLGTHTITYSYTDANGCANTGTTDVLVDACLSIDEQENIGLSIFPNPTTNELNIELNGEFNYEIVDARGRNIAAGSGSESVVLNTTNYETGVYFVTISNENDTVVTRIVKQ